MVYQLSEKGRKLTWTGWKKLGGCGLSQTAAYGAAKGLQLPEAHWHSEHVTLGQIEDVCAEAGRSIARFAVEYLDLSELAFPYIQEEEMKHQYKCVSKKCREKGKVKHMSMSPSEFRAATGSFVKCSKCATALRYVTD